MKILVFLIVLVSLVLVTSIPLVLLLRIILNKTVNKRKMIIKLDNRRMASLVIGCIGAAIAGSYGYQALLEDSEGYKPIIPAYIVFIVGLTSGFLSCFYCSQIFLKFLEDKNWKYGIPLALAFGALAGGISGFLTGFSWYPPIGFFGIFAGGLIGLVIGLISWLLFGKLVFRYHLYIS